MKLDPKPLYKITFADYEEGFGILGAGIIGEWNDCINNDIMF